MADSYLYHDYRIDYVYGHTTIDQKRRIIDFWQRHRVLGNPKDAVRRVEEVVLIAFDQQEQVVGICTVYIERDPQDDQRYFYYRMFIQPGNRETQLMVFMTAMTYKHLKQLKMDDKPKGLIIVSENPKLMRKSARQYLRRLGFLSTGQDDHQRDVWLGKW